MLYNGEERTSPATSGLLRTNHLRRNAGICVFLIACIGLLASRKMARTPSADVDLMPRAALRSMEAPNSPQIEIWQSAMNTGDRLSPKAPGSFVPDFAFQGIEVEVTDVAEQVIEGFGGAFTESSGLVFRKLTDAQQRAFLNDYFSTEGLGYVMGRTHINSCDFSVSSYSFDEVAGDVELTAFDTTLSRDLKALIPLIWAAQKVVRAEGREMKMLASPWSPPAWMKNLAFNPRAGMDHSSAPCLKADMQNVWARYISKWVSSYKAYGIPIWAVTVQNEPENNATWEACLLTAEEEAAFVGQHLGPVLQADHPEVEVFGFDHNKDHVLVYGRTLLQDEAASKYLSGIAYHWYAGDGFDQLKQLKAEFPKAKMLPSEATWEAYRWTPGTKLSQGDWHFGEGYAHDIIGDFNSGAIAWVDWNLILNETGGPNHVNNVCDAAMQVNFSRGEVYHHPQFYYIGHFSKFLTPGSVHLTSYTRRSPTYQGPPRPYGTCTGQDGLQATAGRTPSGKVVLVVLNCGDADLEFKLKYAASAQKFVIPAHAIQTYRFDADVSKVSM